MDINPIDFFILIFLVIYTMSNRTNGFVRNTAKTINLIISIILSSLITTNLSIQFTFLKTTNDIFYLSTYLIIFISLMILLGFIIEFLLEQLEIIKVDKSVDIFISLLTGIINGLLIICLLIFIFDTTPLSQDARKSIYNKLEKKSYIFKPLNTLKDLLF